ncbi:MAG: TetR/AcrR family transcriptional regulator [Acidimicrobiales bacterium]
MTSDPQAMDDDRPLTKSELTRERILDSAAKVFRRQGYSAKLSDIAAEAGLQAGSLYYHFDGREALVAEVLHRGTAMAWARVRKALAALDDEASDIDRLRTALAAHAAAVLERDDYPAAHNRIFSMAPDEVRRTEIAHQKAYGDDLHRLFEAAIASGELRDDIDAPAVRMLLFGAMNWTSEWFDPSGHRSAADITDQLITMAFDGLRPRD